MIGGLALEAAAWWTVGFRHGDVWRVTVPALVVLGVAALVFGPPAWSPEVRPRDCRWRSAPRRGCCCTWRLGRSSRSSGGGGRPSSGTRWRCTCARASGRSRRRSCSRSCCRSRGRSCSGAGSSSPSSSTRSGAGRGSRPWARGSPSSSRTCRAGTWRSWPGAVVGGAVWIGLGWWCGGVLAPLASHVVWTGLMLALPVVRAGAGRLVNLLPARSVRCSSADRSVTSRRSRPRGPHVTPMVFAVGGRAASG